MKCLKCQEQAVIELQHGALCRKHFINYFEDKVFKTINRYQLIPRGENLCVAASGGKDSLTALYLTKKYLKKNNFPNKLFALVIDEGITNYREHTIIDLEKFCKDNEIELKAASYKENYELTLDQAQKKVNKKPCNVCGVWRRYLLNKYAKKYEADKVITGHNLDDEAQVIIMNTFKANTTLAAHIGPISGINETKEFVQRVKPLYFCTEKETRLYTLLRNFKVNFSECPYAKEGYRASIRKMLNEFETDYPGTKQGIVQSFLAILPLLKEQAQKNKEKMRSCLKCQEPANKEICNACKLQDEIFKTRESNR